MKKHIFVLLSAVLLGGMCGCVQKSSSAQYMTFDTVDYVDGFPCVVELTESKEPEFDVIGINDFCIVDSIMFFSQRGGDYLWSLFSLNDNRLLGRCFPKGLALANLLWLLVWLLRRIYSMRRGICMRTYMIFRQER